MQGTDILRALGATSWEELILEMETSVGGTPFRPGDRKWFPTSEWYPMSILSERDGEIRIVAVTAKTPRCGAFRRLLGAIIAAGMVPVVCTPMRVMEGIMRRWGWQERKVPTMHGLERQWRPPAGWKA